MTTAPKRPKLTPLDGEVLRAVADIIQAQLRNTFRPEARAMGHAQMLNHAGLLAGGTPTARSLPPQEAAASLLQAAMSRPDADAIAADLAEAGLLTDAGRTALKEHTT
jgi:hypothetical protein